MGREKYFYNGNDWLERWRKPYPILQISREKA